jgi:hypothetical protein
MSLREVLGRRLPGHILDDFEGVIDLIGNGDEDQISSGDDEIEAAIFPVFGFAAFHFHDVPDCGVEGTFANRSEPTHGRNLDGIKAACQRFGLGVPGDPSHKGSILPFALGAELKAECAGRLHQA